MASNSTKMNKHGLIILGNSGVGKSFLANVLLEEEVFKHEFSPRSVTHRTEYKEITFSDYTYAIFNIPGLIEADQTRVDVNKREIDHAFSQRPNSLIIYVFGQQNGRIRDEDVVAFDSINDAYPFNLESLLIVVNGLPTDRPKTYEGEVMLMLQDIIKGVINPQRVCFLDHINSKDKPARTNLRNQLLGFILELTPREHYKNHDIHLRVDEVSLLKQQIENMTKAFEENKAAYQQEIIAHQQRYDEFVAEQRKETDHFRRIIEKQNEDNATIQQRQQEQFERMQTAHREQVSMLEKQMTSMRREQDRLTEKLEKAKSDERQEIQRILRQSQETQNRLDEKIRRMEEQQPAPPPPAPAKKSSCFISGTQIRMADGTQKSIEDIQIGDLVVGVDHQHYPVMFLDVEQLQDRHLYSINGSQPFVTSEHVFLTTNGNFLAFDPQASEDEEPSLRGVVHRIMSNVQLQSFDSSSPVLIEKFSSTPADRKTIVYNIVLESGHCYFANDYAVFDMFPNLSLYPRMFKFLHLLWRQCATQVDEHFDDVTTPDSIDRLRLEKLACLVQQTMTDFLSKN